VNPWLVRATSLILLHVLVRTDLELVLRTAPSSGAALRYGSVALLVLVALLWAGLDAVREDREDVQRDDLFTRWLKAALLTGPAAGLVGWAVEGLLVDASGTEQLLVELTGGAAFTALLVLVPAALGLFVGRRARPTDPEPEPVPGSAREARRARLEARER
jgi:hypothetical protein